MGSQTPSEPDTASDRSTENSGFVVQEAWMHCDIPWGLQCSEQRYKKGSAYTVSPYTAQNSEYQNKQNNSSAILMHAAWIFILFLLKPTNAQIYITIFFLTINQLDALISQIYFRNEILHVSDSSTIRRFSLYTQQTCITYTIAVCTVKNSW